MSDPALHIDYKTFYEESQLAVMQLRHELNQLKIIFGAKQERFVTGNPTDPAQLSMGLTAEEVNATSLIRAKKIEYTRTEAILTNPVTTHPVE